MHAPTSRRLLLKLTAGLPLALPVFDAVAADQGGLSLYPVRHQPATPAGAIVLVDRDITGFAGDGYYLYPDWGKPVVYEVRDSAGDLAFHYPGAGEPLWVMAAGNGRVRFSGRVEGVLSVGGDAAADHFLATGRWPLLDVPGKPPA